MLATSSPLYRQLADVAAVDLAQVKAADPSAAVGLANRTDRTFATPGACGEVRFVYRLPPVPSRCSRRYLPS